MKPILSFLMLTGASCQSLEKKSEEKFILHPIGWVRKTDNRTKIVLAKKYQPGLLGLDGFSHLFVFYWFDRNDNREKRSVLQVHPRGKSQNPLTGVFATRSPARPNLIAMSLCKIIEIKDNSIEIDSIDALPDSPVIDLKPYLSHSEAVQAVVPRWVDH